MEQDSLFEQMATITKAHAYDILSKQVTELKNCNRELIESLNELISLNEQISQNFNFPAIKKAKTLIQKSKLLSL